MSEVAWMRVAGERFTAGDTPGVLQACLPEVLTLGNIARGHLLEVGKAAEDADIPRLKRAVDAAAPPLVQLQIGLFLAAAALAKAGRGTLERREHGDEAVKTALSLDVAMRGVRGTLLYHSRVIQGEALQAMKLLHYFENRHDERSKSAATWEAFEKAVLHVADEFDSVVFSFRVAQMLLSAT